MSKRIHIGLIVALLGLSMARSSSAGEVSCNGHTFTLPDGFMIELVAAPPLVHFPISADFDEQGRLYVTESGGTGESADKQLTTKPNRIIRLDARPDGQFEHRFVFAEGLSFPEGALWRDGSLYVAAPPSIWKFTPGGPDGAAIDRTEWFAGKTITHCANDLHGPYSGPDGWIYWCKGAFAEQTYDRPGHTPLVTKASHLFRARPDGSGIESVMTGGMDNPVGLAFTAGGEPIISCTFLQQPAGGRRDGLIHAVYGGVFGKVHDVIEGHPRTAPEVMPVLSHLGPAAPCSVIRYESEIFGHDYRDNLFTACFNLHKVTRHILTPDGATFQSHDEDFLICDSAEFHPTHVLEDADGSLIVLDTGGWYHLCCPTSKLEDAAAPGAIYRVRRSDAPRVDDPRGLKLAWSSMSAAELAKLLDDPRPAVRKRAMAALATVADGVSAAGDVVQGSQSAIARLNAVWALTHNATPEARAAIRWAISDRDSDVCLAAIHSASLWRDRDALAKLLAQLTSNSTAERRAAAEAVGRIGDSSAVRVLLNALAAPFDRFLEHSLIYAMIEIGDGKAVAAGLKSESAAVRRAAMIALDQMGSSELQAGTVADALSGRVTRDAAAWIAGHHPDWGDAFAGALAARMRSAELSDADRQNLVRELAALSQSPAIRELLATRARDNSASAAERGITLAAMGASGLKEVPATWLDALSAALSGDDPAVLAAAVSAARKVPMPKNKPDALRQALLNIAMRDQIPATTRLDSLSALGDKIGPLDAGLFTFVTSQLAPTQPATARQGAADILARAQLTAEQKESLVATVRTATPLEIDRLLAAFDKGGDDALADHLLTALQDAPVLKSLRADALRRHFAHFSPAARKRGDELAARLNPDATKQQARLHELAASLPPGDVARGRNVFHSAKTSCVACHAVGYVGGNVGPDLTSIGKIRSEADLLESIVFPSATIVQSFEPVIVDTKDGEHPSGILRGSTSDELVLVTGPNQEVRIRRENVKQIKPSAVSVMPEGFDQILSRQELADLLAFLKACK